jgi:hypothetical protein
MKLGPWFALLMALSSPAQAAENVVKITEVTSIYTYFNKPGATVTQHNSDVIACGVDATKVWSFDEFTNGLLHPGILSEMIGGMLAESPHAGAVAASLENCMVVRGWRVVSLPDDEGKPLAAVSREDLSARLEPWIGAANPHGKIVRVWNNDASYASQVVRPSYADRGQLSLVIATGTGINQLASSPHFVAGRLDSNWRPHLLKPSELASLAPGEGVIMIGLKGRFPYEREVNLNREGPDRVTPASFLVDQPDLLILGKTRVRDGYGEGYMYAAAVRAGRWRISSIGNIFWGINFCLGSPSFELKPGEVVYAGTFDFDAGLGPDLDLTPARIWLAGLPQAELVKPAVYTNGSLGACGDTAIYAFEIKGAPFEPGYTWGAAALLATVPSTAVSGAGTSNPATSSRMSASAP